MQERRRSGMLIAKGLAGGLVQLAVLGALLVVPAGFIAGEWAWPRGWQFIAGYGLLLAASTIFLGIAAPQSLAGRLRPPASARQPREDKAATVLLVGSMLLFLAFIPVDVFALKLFGLAPGGVSALGGVLLLGGYAFIIWTLHSNKFAIPIVEDQSEQGQIVVSTGPYAVVRHPMYLGLLVFLAGVGLWLQSWASMLALLLVAAALVLRIRVEERVLLETLDGYAGYCQRRPFRLLPRVW